MAFKIEEETVSVFYFICSCNNMRKKLKTKKSKRDQLGLKDDHLKKIQMDLVIPHETG